MTSTIIFLFPFLRTQLSSTPKYFKPRVLTAHLGKAAFMEDALTVEYSFAPLVMVPVQLKIVATNLNTTVDVLIKSLERVSVTQRFSHCLAVINRQNRVLARQPCGKRSQ